MNFTLLDLQKMNFLKLINVFAHCYLKHNESEEIIKNCDIGISTLGLYKKICKRLVLLKVDNIYP